MLARTTHQKSRFRSPGVDAGCVDGLHEELRIRPLPILPFLIGAPDPQALLGADQDYRFTHSGLPLQLIMPSGLWTRAAGSNSPARASAFRMARYGVRSQTVVSPGSRPSVKRRAAQQHLAGRKRDGLGPEVGHAPDAAASLEVQHLTVPIRPS